MFIISEDGSNIIPSERIQRFKVTTSDAPAPYVINEDGTKMYADTSDHRPVEYLHSYKLMAYMEPAVPITETICLIESTDKSEVYGVLYSLLDEIAKINKTTMSTSLMQYKQNYHIVSKDQHVITKDLREEELLAIASLNESNISVNGGLLLRDNTTNLAVLRHGSEKQIAELLVDHCDNCTWKWKNTAQLMDWLNSKISK